ncbi:MAG: RNase H family protein [Polyangiaceae bacterium]
MPWVHAILRGSKVYARADERGALVEEGGRVEIRYKPNDGRKYGARADNLKLVDGRILPEETCGAASSVADAKTAKSASASGEATSADASAAPARPSTKRTAKPKAASADEPPPPPTDGTVIHVYADGACSGNPGPAGLGVVILDTESRVELSEYIGQGTNNIAELTAILRALGETIESERPMVIHTDSSYSIGVLQKGWKAKANQELIAELRDLLKGRRGVRLVYVPGHAGVKWNERADSLARAAVASRKTTRHVVRSQSASPRAAGD